VRGADVPTAMNADVGTDYFSTMRVPITAGRAFSDSDDEDAARVAVVNEAFARRFFPGSNPSANSVGKRFSYKRSGGPFVEIVGVAQDGKYFSIGEAPQPFVYFPIAQEYG